MFKDGNKQMETKLLWEECKPLFFKKKKKSSAWVKKCRYVRSKNADAETHEFSSKYKKKNQE